jgi:NAD(P)-dependent dehydrogenase (short-subunit alcohol dehydrogenase family)
VPRSVDGARILVTGASAGIGWSTAIALAELGATLVVHGRRAQRLEDLVGQLKGDGHVALPGDLEDPAGAAALALKAWDALGHLDVIVHNAAMPKRRPVQELTAEEVELTMRVNFHSPVQMTLATLPRMLERGSGAHIYVASTGGRVGIAHESAYCASKFALSGWAEAMAIDLGSSIDVRLIQPGPIDTEIWDRPGSEDPLFSGPKEPPSVVAEAIIAAIEQPGFERYAPDMSAMVTWHVDHLDEYIAAMSAGMGGQQ